ncbi:MAG: hypothetical protein ABR96_03920, partial [cyanobacterium BACL30 MAG-120619-bin27]|jgi:hypothetical protein
MCMAGFFGLFDSFGAHRFQLQDPTLMTLGRFAILFAFGLAAAIAFKLTWLYWLLAAALAAVLLRLRLNG